MQLGASIPVADIGTGPTVLRDYAQAAEELGYTHLVAPDHVLGVNPAADHGGRQGVSHPRRSFADVGSGRGFWDRGGCNQT